MTHIIDTEHGIGMYRLQVLYHRCRMEARGINFKIATTPAVKREFKLPMNWTKNKVAEFLLEYINNLILTGTEVDRRGHPTTSTTTNDK